MIVRFAIPWAALEVATQVCETPDCPAGLVCSGTGFRANANRGLHAATIAKGLQQSFRGCLPSPVQIPVPGIRTRPPNAATAQGYDLDDRRRA